jgi:O-antigen/teichoic acid export membrane protein
MRLWIIPDALNSAAFPAYAGGLKDDRDRVLTLLERVAHYIFPLILPLVLLVVSFAREILTVWISASFATHSATVLAWLAIGVFFSSMGRIPWTLLISCRPDLPAKLVLFEAPLYVSILYVMIRHWGLEGAAMAWTVRSAFNCSMVHALTWWTLPSSSRAIRQNLGLLVIGAGLASGGALIPHAEAERVLYWCAATAMVLSFTWVWLMSAQERAKLSLAIGGEFWSRPKSGQRGLGA